METETQTPRPSLITNVGTLFAQLLWDKYINTCMNAYFSVVFSIRFRLMLNCIALGLDFSLNVSLCYDLGALAMMLMCVCSDKWYDLTRANENG